MTDEIFTEPEETTKEWVDIRMTDPEEGEWDIDLVVVDGQVNYVDLRIRPELLAAFVKCLIDDVDHDRASRILTEVAEHREIDLDTQTGDE